MAGELVTTTSTLAGLMERTQARMSAKFMIRSRLFGAPGWWQEALNSSAVQFPKIPAPSPVSEHSTEADDSSATAKTIAAATATLGIWTEKTTLSKLAVLGGQDVDNHTMAVLLNDVASGVDKHIAAVATEAAFTLDPEENCVTFGAFQNAVTTLRNTGYEGELYAWMTEYMLSQIMDDLRAVNLPVSNEDFINSGYRGRLMNIPIYTLPSSWCPTSTTTSKKNGFLGFKDFGVGIGYHKGDPGMGQGIIHPFIKEESLYYELSATAYVRAAALSATGGILLVSDSATK
jgi:hypothetical protein